MRRCGPPDRDGREALARKARGPPDREVKKGPHREARRPSDREAKKGPHREARGPSDREARGGGPRPSVWSLPWTPAAMGQRWRGSRRGTAGRARAGTGG